MHLSLGTSPFGLAIATRHDLEMAQFDVKTAFLNGELQEEIYMDIPEGVVSSNKNQVCKLNKSLYGLKQASRQWNIKFDYFLKNFNFEPSSADPCVYKGIINNTLIFLGLYVDDGIILAETKEALDTVIHELNSSFDITVCNSNYFVGFHIERNRIQGTTFINQKAYIQRILIRFGMIDARSVGVPLDVNTVASVMNEKGEIEDKIPYREAIGSLMFLSKLTRPDISYAVNIMSRFLMCYNETYWRGIKRIFRYLAGTSELGILYKKTDKNSDLLGYSDVDYAGDLETRRSTLGYIFLLSGGPVSWCSQRQKSVALSTTEAEYVAASMASRELIWIQQLLHDIQNSCTGATGLMIDNQSAIKLVKNPEFHKRSKHIDIHYHFIREKLLEGKLFVKYVKTEDQYADFLTKVLSKDKFVKQLNAIGVCQLK